MVTDYLLPKLAMSMNEGTLNKWLVEEGEKVSKGQLILELETDKVVQEVESPQTGYFHRVAQEGETLKVETLIAQITETVEELAALSGFDIVVGQLNNELEPLSESDNAPEPLSDSTKITGSIKQRTAATPSARKLARDNQIDLASIEGSGPRGCIIKEDVIAILDRKYAEIDTHSSSSSGLIEKARIEIKGARKSIASKLQKSLSSSAQVTSAWEIDITELLSLKHQWLEQSQHLSASLSVNSLLLKAITYAIKEVPIANACVEGEELVIYETINIGVAVSVAGQNDFDQGLLVPVLKNVDSMGLLDIDLSMKSLVSKARSGALTPDDISGATITMSSTAGLAPPGCQSTPILSPPNTLIINPSTPMQKPAIYQGEMVSRTLMPMSMTYDHRVVDGAPAAKFASALTERLTRPEWLMQEQEA